MKYVSAENVNSENEYEEVSLGVAESVSLRYCPEGSTAFSMPVRSIGAERTNIGYLCIDVNQIVEDGIGFVEPITLNDWKFTRDVRPLLLIIRGIMVFFAIAGYSAKEAGGAGRRGGGSGVVFKNVLGLSLVGLVWFIIGHGIARGPTLSGFMGSPYQVTTEDFLENPFAFEGDAGWFFSFAAASVAASIATGSIAGRSDLRGFGAMTLVVALFVHPFVFHWQYLGWLSGGVKDFEILRPVIDAGHVGSVHIVGGVAGLTGAWVLGPRLEWESRRRREASGSKVLRALGAFIVWFGSFGLLRFTNGKAHAMVTLGGGIGGLTAGCLSYVIMVFQIKKAAHQRRVSYILRHRESLKAGKRNSNGSGPEVDPKDFYNENAAAVNMEINILTSRQSLVSVIGGAIAGFVSVAGAAETSPIWAVFPIAAIGGCLFVASEWIIPRMGIDDPHESFSVHGITGMWSLLAAALFFENRETGKVEINGEQIVSQLVALSVISLWAFFSCLLGLWIASIVRGGEIRVSREREIDELIFEKAAAALGEDKGGEAASDLMKTLTNSAKNSSDRNSSAVSAGTKTTMFHHVRSKFPGFNPKKRSTDSSSDKDMIFDIASTPITLSEVLENRYQLREFLRWCRKSRSEESVLFWIACDRFRKRMSVWRALCCNREDVYGFSGKKVFEEANTIYEKFVANNAELCVFLPHEVKERLETALRSGNVDRNVYREAQGVVHRDMATGLLPSFLQDQRQGALGDLMSSEMQTETTNEDISYHTKARKTLGPKQVKEDTAIYQLY